MYAKHMLTEAGRQVLTEIAKHGRARRYSQRSKFAPVVRALLDHRYVRVVHSAGDYTITDAGVEALKR